MATTDGTYIDSFKHEPLETTRQQIRLISIIPESSGQINCKLENAYLEDDKTPDYRAISYVWGPPTPLAHISINGQSFEVRQNLHAFLEAFRARLFKFRSNSFYEADTQWLWIDQICIDQTVISERNHQVQMMSEIYSRAAYVYVWLGPSQADVEAAMTLLKSGLRRYYEERTFSSQKKKRKRYRVLEFDEEGDTRNKTSSQPPSLPISALRRFFENTYWQRLWIVQEIMLARYVRIICGETLLSWDELKRFCLSSIPRLSAQVQDCVPKQVIWLAKHALSAKKYTYSDLLATFSKSQCYDTRDKVYGLQGLIKPVARLKIDYAKSATAVFRDAFRSMDEDESDLVRLGDGLKRLQYGDSAEKVLQQACLILAAEAESIIRLPFIIALEELGDHMGLYKRPSYSACIGRKALQRIDFLWSQITAHYTERLLPALYEGDNSKSGNREYLLQIVSVKLIEDLWTAYADLGGLHARFVYWKYDCGLPAHEVSRD